LPRRRPPRGKGKVLATILAQLCIVAATIAFLGALSGRITLHDRRQVMVAAILLRLVPCLLLTNMRIWDLDSYEMVAAVWNRGFDVYTYPFDAVRHPYFPLQIYAIVGLERVASFTELPFTFLIHLPPLLADVGIVALLLRRDARAGFLYAINPVTPMMLAFGAAFDAIPMFLMIGAILIRSKPVPSALMLGLAIADKTWPLLLLPVLAYQPGRWGDAVKYGLTALTVPLLAVLAYSAVWGTPVEVLLRTPLRYGGIEGRWGLGILGFPRLAMMLILAGMSLYVRDWREPLQRVFIVLLTFYVFMSGFGIQYLAWIVPFALLAASTKEQSHYVVSVVAAGLIIYPFESHTYLYLLLLPAWVVGVRWLILELREGQIGDGHTSQQAVRAH
jgi:hypothetical protein